MSRFRRNRDEHNLKILIIGSTDLTRAVIDRCTDVGLSVVGIVTADAEFSISYSPIRVRNFRHYDLAPLAKSLGVPLFVYDRNADELAEFVSATGANFGLVAGWYHMVGRKIRARLSRGCVGFHASLLPDLRGGAPLNWAILSGRTATGVSMFELTDGVDDGPVYASSCLPIRSDTYIGDLVAASERAILEIIARDLPKIAAGKLKPRPQRGTPTYCLQRVPTDGQIDWHVDVKKIERLIRAVSRPYPGAYTFLDGKRLVIWRAKAAQRSRFPEVLGAPGQIFSIPGSGRTFVLCGAGALEMLEAEIDGSAVDAGAMNRWTHRRLASAP